MSGKFVWRSIVCIGLLLAAMPVCAQTPPAGSPQSKAPSPPQADPKLTLITNFARSGASDLALHLLNHTQPAFTNHPVAWMQWERERIYIYQARKKWRAIVTRMTHMPAGVPADFRIWERSRAADAYLQMGKASEARQILQELIWQSGGDRQAATLTNLRQMVIRSYLEDRDLRDAQTAVLRYRQDYPQDEGRWRILQARLYLRTGQPGAALDALKGVKPDAEISALRQLAELRTNTAKPGKIFQQAVHTGTNNRKKAAVRARAWFIAAEAAHDEGNKVAHVAALEQSMGIAPSSVYRDAIFGVHADALWNAYYALGIQLGNDLQLIVGDDQGWFLAASNRFDTSPVKARALFTVVTYNAANEHEREVANWQFATLMNREKFGGEVLERLYLDSKRFPKIADIPPAVRYILVEHVLAKADIPLASKLMQGLDKPPQEADPVQWQLRRARVFVLGGNPEAGIKVLSRLMASGAQVDGDKLLKVLFDLQTVGYSRQTIPFFNDILSGKLATQQRREILYWLADSYKAIHDYARAGELYLDSAIVADPFAMDQWAQTARYQAASMLAKAGMTADARALYEALLNATRDPARQAVLRREIQNLSLGSADRHKQP